VILSTLRCISCKLPLNFLAAVDNPIPSLFKERLFVFLSRFCPVRYCIVRHCGFLVGRGHSSGDCSVSPQTIDQVLKLLKVALVNDMKRAMAKRYEPTYRAILEQILVSSGITTFDSSRMAS
jgi:hypothetical protein